MGSGNHVLDKGPDAPLEGAILRGEGTSHCKVQGHTAVISAKTSEPIKTLFGFWAHMSPRNHVLDGSPQVLRDIAMATNFGTEIVITGFV